MSQGPTLGRRLLLSGLAATGAGLLPGCTSSASPAASGQPSSPATTPSAPPTGSPSPTLTPAAPGIATLPVTHPWRPTASEVSPAVKLRAVRLLEAVLAWPPGGRGLAAARARAAALGYDPRLADQLAGLLTTEPSAAVQVVDAQYGGILSASSSVLVVLRQWLAGTAAASGASGPAVTAGGTTVDVRLVAATPHWRVTALHPAAPGAPATRLSSLAAGLLAEPRLRLPVAAHADLRSGTISPGVLSALRGLADRHVIDLSVVKSGHPLYVFGTSRRSDHPPGHAVDIWAVDGKAVVEPANRALVESAMRLGIALGAYQVGGPVDLDGGGSRYFSDNTHHDHIHLGFHA